MVLLRALGFLWALPLTIVGFLLALISRPKSWAWSDGALDVVVDRMPLTFGFAAGARTLGFVICYLGYMRSDRTRRHERVHVLQCMIFGPLMFVLYPLASLLALASGGDAYYDNAFERWARAGSEE